MAATFVTVTLDDMDKFLKRAFRPFKPKPGTSRGEVYYDLNVSKGNIFIRVWTSVRPQTAYGADVGSDAIRVTMITKGGKPLVSKQTIVKRTQGWRGNLQERIEGLLEDYEAKVEYWKKRQVERDNESPAHSDPSGDEPESGVTQNRFEQPNPPRTGSFARLPDGSWGARVTHAGFEGEVVILVRMDGKRSRAVLDRRARAGSGFELWSIQNNRQASDSEPEEFEDDGV